jgi:hypothetical protein
MQGKALTLGYYVFLKSRMAILFYTGEILFFGLSFLRHSSQYNLDSNIFLLQFKQLFDIIGIIMFRRCPSLKGYALLKSLLKKKFIVTPNPVLRMNTCPSTLLYSFCTLKAH